LLELRMRRRSLNENEKKVLELVSTYAPDADVITILDLTKDKEQFDIKSEHTPDILIIVKEGNLGRLIGREGERINKIEEEVGMKLRGMEFTLDFRTLIRMVHPIAWIHKWVLDADFMGPYLAVRIDDREAGAFLGQKGTYVRFLDAITRKLIGIGIKTVREQVTRRR